MLFTHLFGSVETLSRAKFWLTMHGFDVEHKDLSTHRTPRLALNLDFSQSAAALALIDSIERCEPEGWSLPYTQTREIHDSTPDSLTASSPIHWHSRDDAANQDAICDKVAEYMFSRWE